MKKKITHILCLLLILTIPFTCVYVIFQELYCQEDTSILNETESEIAEDEGLTDSHEVHFHSIGSGVINNQAFFNFNLLSNSQSNISYFFNIQDIYLGLSTPPPKSFIS